MCKLLTKVSKYMGVKGKKKKEKKLILNFFIEIRKNHTFFPLGPDPVI